MKPPSPGRTGCRANITTAKRSKSDHDQDAYGRLRPPIEENSNENSGHFNRNSCSSRASASLSLTDQAIVHLPLVPLVLMLPLVCTGTAVQILPATPVAVHRDPVPKPPVLVT